jgi:hypothetical protein
MSIQAALVAAERLLPGVPAPDGTEGPRWQAIIEVGLFAKQEPQAIWPFVMKWESHEAEDLRSAIATCLLEHLLEYHFDLLFPRIETAAKSNIWFDKATARCWKFAQVTEPKRADSKDSHPWLDSEQRGDLS